VTSRAPLAARSDEGISLIEAVVALTVLIIIAVVAASLAVNALRTATTEDRAQTAISVATLQMEMVRGKDVSIDDTGVSALFGGRTKSDVLALRAANADVAAVSDTTYPEWDPTATASSADTVPATGSMLLNGTTFDWSILLGSCYIETGSTAELNGLCGVVPSISVGSVTAADADDIADAVPAQLPGYTKLMRAIVVVRWEDADRCPAGGCEYSVTSLFEANRDLKWRAG